MSFARTPTTAVPIALLVLVHCSTGGDAEDGCRRMMDAVVLRQPTLACGAPVYCATIGKQTADGAVRYRETELATCLREIRSAPPCAIPAGWPLALLYRAAPACAATFGGARGEGDACSSSIECGWDSVCKGEPAVCTKVPGVGQPCEHSVTGRDCQDGLVCSGPTQLVGDLGFCVNEEAVCPSPSPSPACTDESAELGETCRPAFCEDFPATTAHSGFRRCSSPHDCGGGLVCDPGETLSKGVIGKCVMPVTFR